MKWWLCGNVVILCPYVSMSDMAYAPMSLCLDIAYAYVPMSHIKKMQNDEVVVMW